MHRKLIHIIALLVCSLAIHSQELRCTVSINRDQVPSANQQTFQSLEQAITELMNTTKWTNLTFAEHERIDCQLMIVCKSVSETGLYTCEATIQASRPVYNTTYTSPLLNLKDKNFSFTWNMEPLNVQLTTFEANLPSMLAYYAYLILGYDADSYQRMGGTPYFQQCENIITLCQTASMESVEQVGWQAFERNANRYSLCNNLLDEAFAPIRQYYYEYHRLGLDEMANNVSNGRARIANGMKALKDSGKARMKNDILTVFLDSKSDELILIFQGGTDQEKDYVFNLLMELDPTRSDNYERIKQ
ncbi:MAG: DUF4835 family protein [Paludibacteraceae bacterium]